MFPYVIPDMRDYLNNKVCIIITLSTFEISDRKQLASPSKKKNFLSVVISLISSNRYFLNLLLLVSRDIQHSAFCHHGLLSLQFLFCLLLSHPNQSWFSLSFLFIGTLFNNCFGHLFSFILLITCPYHMDCIISILSIASNKLCLFVS